MIEIATALNRLAAAHERIAAVLEDEAKIGGGLQAVGRIADALHALALEVSVLPVGK